MTDLFEHRDWVLWTGGVREQLQRLPDSCVQTCITSPPYWRTRQYPDAESPTWSDGWVGHLGREPEPEQYVAHLVEVFEGVHRVLRDDGTFWLVIGDCYAKKAHPAWGLKKKDLIGIPFETARALRSAGWYWRSDIVWAKKNACPSPVSDRPTSSHEFVYLFTKSSTYFYDADAVREPLKCPKAKGIKFGGKKYPGQNGVGNTYSGNTYDASQLDGRNRRDVWFLATSRVKDAHCAPFPETLVRPCLFAGTSEMGACRACGTPIAWQKPAKDATAKVWLRTCSCNDDRPPEPCVVLDPFSGSGSTGVVARKAGRRYVGIDMSEEYQQIAAERILEVDRAHQRVASCRQTEWTEVEV